MGGFSESHPVCNTHPPLHESECKKKKKKKKKKGAKITRETAFLSARLGLRVSPGQSAESFLVGFLRGDSGKQGRFKRNLLAINHVQPRVRHLLVHK